MKINKEQWVTLLFYFFFIALVSISSYMIYQYERDEHYTRVDDKLLAVAKGAAYLVAPDFHDRAIDASSITSEEDNRNIDRLSKIAKNFQVSYLYTLVEKDGKIYFTTSSASDEERKSGENLTHYFDHYAEASETVHNAFMGDEPVFVEEADHWGTFRSVLVPMESPNGNKYLSGADISTSVLHERINEEANEHVLIIVGLFLLSLPIFIFRLKAARN